MRYFEIISEAKIRDKTGTLIDAPRVFYRGQEPGRTERIRTGDDHWDSKLFLSSQWKSARLYGSEVTKWVADPDAKIAYEGTRPFLSLTKGTSRLKMFDQVREIVRRAEKAGYDAVWFRRQADIGTAVINRAKFHPVEVVDDPEPIEEDLREMPSSEIVKQLAPEICTAAQRVYDDWQQDENGVDEVYGTGGICEKIANEIGDVLASAGINVTSGGDDEHACIIAQFADGIFTVDIPYAVYERGGFYTWRKIPNVKFEPRHVVVELLDRNPDHFEQYQYE